MLQEGSKRAAPTSPPGDPNRNAKRPRPIGTDLWSEDEHRQQDEKIKQYFLENLEDNEHLKVNDIQDMTEVINTVRSVASEGPHSHMIATGFERKIFKDAELLKLVGDCYKKGSYKDVRCLGVSFLPPVVIKL